MNWDTLIDVFAVIGALSCLWFGARGLLAFLGWVERSEIERQRLEESAAAPKAKAKAKRPSAAGGDIPADHVAAIAAVITAIGHRVVMISDIGSDNTWSSEGRWLHQTSHRTH